MPTPPVANPFAWYAADQITSPPSSQSYDSTILGDNPRTFWKLNESSGTTVTDYGSLGLNLALSGGYTLAQTGIGDGETAILFNGSTGSATATPVSALTSPYSLECWIKPTNVTQTAGTFFGSRGPSGNSLDVKTNGATTIHSDIGDGSNWLDSTADTTGLSLSAGAWYHVVYVVTSTGFSSYVNAVAKNTGSWSSATPLIWDVNHHPFVGGGSSSEYFAGAVAKVAIYNYALTPTQVSNHYAAQTLSGPTLSSWNDLSGNGHTLNATSSASVATFQSSLVNGLPAVAFDGVSSTLSASITQQSQPQTVFVAVVPGSLSGTDIVFSGAYGGAGSFGMGQSASGLYYQYGSNNVSSGSVISTGKIQFWTYQANGTSSFARANGVLVVNAGSPGSDPLQNLILGSWQGHNYWTGSICEVLVYTSALTTAQIQSVESYLMDKWAETSPLPTPPVPGPSAWYSADKINASLTNGSSVTFWPDLSGNNHALEAVGSASAATFHTNQQNGLPGVTFSTLQGMQASNAASATASASIFMVMDDTTVNNGYNGFVMSGNYGLFSYYAALDVGSVAGAAIGPYNFSTNTPYIVSGVINTTASAGQALVNLCPNGSFEHDSTGTSSPAGWSIVSGAAHVLGVAAATFSGSNGSHVGQLPDSSGQGLTQTVGAVTTTASSVSPNLSYTVTAAFEQLSSGGGDLSLSINWYNNSSGLISTSTGSTGPSVGATGTGTVSVTATSPSNAVSATVQINKGFTANYYNIDAIQFAPTTQGSTYYDGSSGSGWTWSGTVGNSVSQSSLITILRVNGAQKAVGSAAWAPTSNLSVGWSSTIAGFTGNIYEILVYPAALSTSNITAVEKYLLDKWTGTSGGAVSLSAAAGLSAASAVKNQGQASLSSYGGLKASGWVVGPVTGGIMDDFQAWLSSDARHLITALAAMFEQVYGIVNELGSIDNPVTWVPAWSTLLDVDACPTWALPYLGMFNGTGVMPGQADASARAQIRYESPFKRGQGYSGTYNSTNGQSGGAIVVAAQKYLSGDQTVVLIERTNNSGNSDPYWFQLVVESSELVSASNLVSSVNAVKPGGVQWTLVPTTSWIISQLESGYTTIGQVESTFSSITNLEGNQT